jgi:hypothetical protein
MGNPVIAFTYNDKGFWPTAPDGLGYSLNSVEQNPTGDPNLYSYWKSSQYYHGSPMANDYGVGVKELPGETVDFSLYPNPTNDVLTIALTTVNGSENFRVKIYSIGGVLLYNEAIDSENVISLKEFGLTPGVYLVRAESEKAVITRKLILTW